MGDQFTFAVSSSVSEFTNKLYQILAKNDGNIIFSPICAHAVLDLLHQGATGRTAQSLENVLHILSRESIAKEYKEVMSVLNAIQNVSLTIANKIFVHHRMPLKDSFKSVATEYFLSEAENIDFDNSADAAAQINRWVEDKTNNKIKNFFNACDINSRTRIILINTVYFHGNWLNQFSKLKTATEPFYVSETDTVDCDLMHSEHVYFDYAESDDLDAQIIRLPYKNANTCLFVVLPKTRGGIESLETKLADIDFLTLTKQLKNIEVEVYLPRFKIEMNISLKEPLTKLGLASIFEEAELSQMAESEESLFCSEVIQKAVIDVYEEGTVAAAASAVRLVGCSRHKPMPPKPLFRADRPFVFSIVVDNQYILFFGRITKPEKSSFKFKSREEELVENIE